MKKWYYGWELLELRNWTPSELLNHVRAGLPAYDEVYRLIYDVDALRKKQTLKEIEREQEAKRKKAEEWAGPCMPLPKSIIEGIHATQKGTPIIPPGHEAMSFTEVTDKAAALKQFDRIKLLQFNYKELAEFEKNNGLTVEEQPIPVIQKQINNTVSTEDKQKEALKEIGSKGGKHEKENKVLIKAIHHIFEIEPKYITKAVSSTWNYIKREHDYTTPLKISKGKLFFDDDKIITQLNNGKEKAVARSTFDKYVAKIKEEIKNKPTK